MIWNTHGFNWGCQMPSNRLSLDNLLTKLCDSAFMQSCTPLSPSDEICSSALGLQSYHYSLLLKKCLMALLHHRYLSFDMSTQLNQSNHFATLITEPVMQSLNIFFNYNLELKTLHYLKWNNSYFTLNEKLYSEESWKELFLQL
jgi:hypothetical protein